MERVPRLTEKARARSRRSVSASRVSGRAGQRPLAGWHVHQCARHLPQLKKVARKAADSPAVQQAAGAAQAQAAGLARSAKDQAMRRVPRLTEKARNTVPGPIGDRIPGRRTREANGHSQGGTYTGAPGAPGTGSQPPA